MGSKTTTTTTGSTSGTQTNELPQWQQDYLTKQVLPMATKISETPFSAYTADRTAGFTGAEQQAQNAFGAMAGMTPQDYAAQTQANMNPYMTNVVDATLAAADRNRAMQRVSENANITNANAFGGNRRDVYQGERQATYDLGVNQQIADLMAQGYSQAQAQTMAQLQQQGTSAQNLAASGATQRGVSQADMDAAYAEFMRGNEYPMQQLNALLSGFSAIPAGLGTQTSASTSSGTNVEKKGGAGNVLSAIGSAAKIIPLI